MVLNVEKCQHECQTVSSMERGLLNMHRLAALVLTVTKQRSNHLGCKHLYAANQNPYLFDSSEHYRKTAQSARKISDYSGLVKRNYNRLSTIEFVLSPGDELRVGNTSTPSRIGRRMAKGKLPPQQMVTCNNLGLSPGERHSFSNYFKSIAFACRMR